MDHKSGRHGSLFGKSKVDTRPGLPFRLRDDYLLPEQLTFFKLLLSAVGDLYIVCPRVSLNDIFIIIDENKYRHLADNIRQKKIDFLLCDPHAMIPLVGLELAGKCNPMEKQRDQEVFIDDIFEAAKLPLIRIYIDNPCNPEELRESILEVARGEEIDVLKREMLPESEPLTGDRHQHSELPDALPRLEASGLKDLQQEKLFRQPEPQPETASRPAAAIEEPPQTEQLDNGRSGEAEAMAAADEMADGGSAAQPEIRLMRFMNSQAEQTPGIDFFTGSFSDVGLSSYVSKTAEILPGVEASSGVQPVREDKFDPEHGFKNEPWNIEQFKIKMKKEIEQAAWESLQSGAPECSRCASAMSLRTSKRGYRFYVCSNYPHCREVKGLYE